MRRLIIMGAGGRDFHNFNVAFRDDPATEVVAFTAAQIPGIAGRTYPAELAGSRYPEGIPIHDEAELAELIAAERVDEVVFAYSDLSYEEVMHRGAIAQAAGADFTILGPGSTLLRSTRPVVAVCAVRTGAGKSPASRRVGRILLDAGLRVALLRHPMPYHDLDRLRVQRFESVAEIDASNPTIEEREEYERPAEMGMIVYAGIDYAAIVTAAEAEADVLIWDGGNNDIPFVRPDLHLTVVDPLRPGDELRYHPGEVNLRMADAVILSKASSAEPEAVERVLANVAAANPGAPVVRADSVVSLDDGPSLRGARVLVVEDGPTITHGGMPFGAGTVAARQAGAEPVDPRPTAAGSLADTFAAFPHIGAVLPAMGYSDRQLADLERTINATQCDAVIAGTPIDLGRIVSSRHPIRRVGYELEVRGEPSLEGLLAPLIERASGAAGG